MTMAGKLQYTIKFVIEISIAATHWVGKIGLAAKDHARLVKIRTMESDRIHRRSWFPQRPRQRRRPRARGYHPERSRHLHRGCGFPEAKGDAEAVQAAFPVNFALQDFSGVVPLEQRTLLVYVICNYVAFRSAGGIVRRARTRTVCGVPRASAAGKHIRTYWARTTCRVPSRRRASPWQGTPVRTD